MMKLADYFKSLADETRLRLVNLLWHHELNVNEIVEILKMGQPRISRHLKILADHHLLTYRRDGLWTFYKTPAEGNGFNFIKTLTGLFRDEEVFSDDLISAKKVIEKRAKETTRFFDSIAEDWTKLKNEIFGDFDLNNLILKHIPKSHTVVDLGCGTGDLLISLKKISQKVIGVDKSPKMLEEAKKRFSGKKGKLDFRIGEIEHLPLGDGETDLAIINMVLHHLPSPISAFKEINRTLKKNKYFVIVDFLKHNLESMRTKYGDHWLGFREREIEKWLGQTGFVVTKKGNFKLQRGLNGIILCSKKIKQS